MVKIRNLNTIWIKCCVLAFVWFDKSFPGYSFSEQMQCWWFKLLHHLWTSCSLIKLYKHLSLAPSQCELCHHHPGMHLSQHWIAPSSRGGAPLTCSCKNSKESFGCIGTGLHASWCWDKCVCFWIVTGEDWLVYLGHSIILLYIF